MEQHGENWCFSILSVQISVTEKHRGLVINTRTGGLWWGHFPGYEDKGTCITHLNPTDKDAVTFVFRTHRDEIPEFTGGFALQNASNL